MTRLTGLRTSAMLLSSLALVAFAATGSNATLVPRTVFAEEFGYPS